MTTSATDLPQPLHVVVAGGGVAGLEAVIALRDLAGDRVRLTLVAPNEEFAYRPLSVGEPFALGAARQTKLAQFAAEFGAELRPESLASVHPDTHSTFLGNGAELGYDKLIVATGASRVPAYEHATTFRGQEDVENVHGLVQDLEGAYVRRIAFVVPPGVAWSVPIYELALMAAQRAFEMCVDVELTLVTPEERPLAVFGPQASADVQGMLEAAGITIHCSAVADIPASGTVIVRPGNEVIECDRVIALPVIRAKRIKGLPADPDSYLPIDPQCRVRGVDDVYAAGDGVNFPLKQGGLACQQADVAAQNIARHAGVPGPEGRFRPVLRGQLLTGGKAHYMTHDVSGRGAGPDESTDHILWWPPTKVAGTYLAPYLALEEETDRAQSAGNRIRRSALVERGLETTHEVELRGYEFASR
jgi:sulfide:quinone oxidoreductase